MIGQRNVLVSKLRGSLDHLLNRRTAVRIVRVRVEIAAEIFELNQTWQLPFERSLDLAPIFAQLRGRHRHIHRPIHILFARAGDALRSAKDAVLI